MKTKRRHPLDKTTFLESNREKWALIFCVIGSITQALYCYGLMKDPAPFLTYFTGIGVTFILGASADSVMKAYKVDSSNYTENLNSENKIEEIKKEEVTVKHYELPLDEELEQRYGDR